MKTQSIDTHPEIEKIQISMLHDGGVRKRTALLRSITRSALTLARHGIKKAHPNWDNIHLGKFFVYINYGDNLSNRLQINDLKGDIMISTEILDSISPLVSAFKKIGIPYHLGGSVVSSIYGIPRSTIDVDVIVDMKPGQIQRLVNVLKSEYYIDEKSIYEAIQSSSSFNIIHLRTMLKVDIFILKKGQYDRIAFSRRKKEMLSDEPRDQFFLATPEDIVLNKLKWYEMSEGISERQWNDVLGVLKVQRDHLDITYLTKWAHKLGLLKLLQQALDDAGIQFN